MTESNPYSAPEADLDTGDSLDPTAWPGIRRRTYWGLLILVQVLGIGVIAALAGAGTPEAAIFVQLISVVIMVTLARLRLINIGNSGWWALLIVVPLANVIVGLRCAAYPTGYVEHKTMDRAGKIILGLVIGVFVLGIIAAIALPAYQDYIEAANAAAGG